MAVILLLCFIAVLLVVRFYGRSGASDTANSDFNRFEKEISDFEKQLSIKEDTTLNKKKSGKKKFSPVYRPRVQSFEPVEREVESRTVPDRDFKN